ncbi:DegT/DnrJ/EryC1/StrS family aminotransferase [Streptomyces celluloflavus]|uniref:DegT/DnrJ/EryC1/StrS family aminotransferase n=1 Tax=Streptomyces celluloflavus TaxID=58344 RepID=UPI00365E00DD
MTAVEPHEAEDLRYTVPPRRPVLELHPSRMSARRCAAVLYHAARPDAGRARLVRQLRAASAREHCVVTASGRAALRSALRTLGAVPGREVVVSTFNCPAVADAVLATGATPVLVDTSPDAGSGYTSVDLRDRLVVLTNVLGLDEWRQHAHHIAERGGIPVLDLAQAVPAPGTLLRYRTADCPLVLSFGAGKPLGGIGGGAVLHPPGTSGTARPAPEPYPYPASCGGGPGGGAVLRGAVAARLLGGAPGAARAAVQRARQRAPGWSATKADHLPQEAGAAQLLAPRRWETAAATALLGSAEALRRAAVARHEEVRAAVAPLLEHCTVIPSRPDLVPGIELLFRRRGDRQVFARTLAGAGVPSTWNYFPLHRMRPYARYAGGPLPGADHLWPRVLTVPKQPQPRLGRELLVTALLAADRAVGERGGRTRGCHD